MALVALVVPLAGPLLFFPSLGRERRRVSLQQRAREPRADRVVAGRDDRVEPGVKGLAAAALVGSNGSTSGGGRSRRRRRQGLLLLLLLLLLREPRPGRE